MNIVLTIIILGVIIFIHEFGHFFTAKLFKMPVSEFSIGMGPKMISKKRGETSYSLRWIPIGGFVSIDGMEVESKVEDGFNTKKPWKRLVVLAAGVFMNFILAYMILVGIALANGKTIFKETPIIGQVIEDTKAFSTLKKGDIVLSIDDMKIDKWKDISTATKDKKNGRGNPKRDDETRQEKLELTLDKQNNRYYIGILPEYEIIKYSFGEAILEGAISFKNIFYQTISGFKMLFTGKVKADEVAGPVGMVKIVGQFKENSMMLFWLTALLSINIGILNFLPFPALDGGRIVFVFLEMIGITVNKKIEERLHMFGMLLLILFIIFITANDIFKLFK